MDGDRAGPTADFTAGSKDTENAPPRTTAPAVARTKQIDDASGTRMASIADPSRADGDGVTPAETESPAALEVPRFEPLRSQWRYGQAVFARYKKTPYFYSGNIATYLGAGLFMVVFDDGTLNYRVRREDLLLRLSPEAQGEERKSSCSVTATGCSSAAESAPSAERRSSSPSKLQAAHGDWHSNSSIVHQNPVMVDFSLNPPRQLALYGSSRSIVGDEVAGMKRLECGVGYEDDSTQVSDSDESSEEDMSMTPWQQMTQTFGMGKVRARAARRSSVSSLSQGDRLSVSQNGVTQVLPTSKGLKQAIQDFLARKTTKVQPAAAGSDVVLLERLRSMETRARELAAGDLAASTRVVMTHPADGGARSYGTIKTRLASGDFEVIREDEQAISVQVVAPDALELLPSGAELELQRRDLARTVKPLYAGRKVQVNMYPGSRFSGHGVVTLEVERDATFNVLLQNRIRLVNVPASKLVPVREKQKRAVAITEDQFLVCAGKAKVYIGEQVFVQCEGEGVVEEKLGVLNGVFSNKTAAVDFADGSTGYEVAPALITKRKRARVAADDADLLSLKNAVLMQASGGAELLEVGFHVKADHPRKASVETCVVIKRHMSAACDVRFSDGTIAFEVFPSQMILDAVAVGAAAPALLPREAAAELGDYVLAWSSRFGRYCSAKIAAKACGDGVAAALYTVVFDYGEQKANVPLDKLAPLDLPDALAPTQKLTNYSIDTIGFEIAPVAFTVGEAVAARVHGSVQYFRGWVEAVHEKERVCAVLFDSSERDERVPFSAMFSVDVRTRFQSLGTRVGSSSGGADRLSRFQDESSAAGATVVVGAATAVQGDDAAPTNRRRRHSGGSVGSIIMSVAGSIFRLRKETEDAERRRGSHLVTEMGAVLRRRPDA